MLLTYTVTSPKREPTHSQLPTYQPLLSRIESFLVKTIRAMKMAQLCNAAGITIFNSVWSEARIFVWILMLCALVTPASSNLLRHHSFIEESEYIISDENRLLQDGTWVDITYDDFENGFGSFTDGGGDADIESKANTAHQGTNSLCLRDNSGVASSAYSTDGIDVRAMGYSALRISFWFYMRSMKNGEGFFFEYSDDDGANWIIVEEYARGNDFDNNVFYNAVVDLDEVNYILDTASAKIRFQCNGGSNNDKVNIDEVLVQGLTPAADTGPSDAPSFLLSTAPSEAPSELPSLSPSDVPSDVPSSFPSPWPSGAPSSVPSDNPSERPSLSREPSVYPSERPSLSYEPSSSPSNDPSSKPSTNNQDPTPWPSGFPSLTPSEVASDVPSFMPSNEPSASSEEPFLTPSEVPSNSQVPSTNPSELPSISSSPSVLPSSEPSLSSMPSTVPSLPLTREDICPLDRVNPPEKYEITPYVDSNLTDNVDDDLNEISSLVFSDQISPSGNRYAYVVSDKEQFSLKVIEFNDNPIGAITGEGTTVATYVLHLDDYSNDDWEDISLGPCSDSNVDSAYSVDDTCIYIGNIGNNIRPDDPSYTQREVLKIFKFVEPVIDTSAPQNITELNVATIEFRYDGFDKTFNNAETMFVDWKGVEESTTERMGDIYIVTKDGCAGGVGKIPIAFHKNLGPGETSQVYDMLPVMNDPPSQGVGVTCSDGPYRVWTGGDMSRDGILIALIRDGPPASVYFFPRLAGQSVVDALSDLPCSYVSSTSYGLENEKKHEAVAFVDSAGAKFADISECQGSCSPTLYVYDLEYAGDVTPRIDEPATGWVTITYDDFEAGNFGNYISGGIKAVVSDSTGCGGSCACLGTHALKLSGSGIVASFSSSEDLSCDAYSLLRITFQFQFNGYDHLDTLFAELSLDGGTTYAIVGDWARDVADWDANGEEYVNGDCSNGKILASPATLMAPSFGNELRLRFRNSANSDFDEVYVDDIRVEGNLLTGTLASSTTSTTSSEVVTTSQEAAITHVDTTTAAPKVTTSTCPLDRVNPPEKYEITPYVDGDLTDNVDDDLNEISSLVFSDQISPSGNRYAYVVSDKEQFSLKVIEFNDNLFGDYISGVGTTVATYELNLDDYSNDDWEDISLGPCSDSNIDSAYSVDDTCIYIGNIGNNIRPDDPSYTQREVLKIFKFVEPVIDTSAPQNITELNVATIEFRYDSTLSGFDQPINNAETMFVDWKGVEGSSTEQMGDIYVVTTDRCSGGVGKIPVAVHKNVGPGETSQVYDMPPVMIEPPRQGVNVTCSDGPYREWTGGDMSRNGQMIALVRGGPPASVYFFLRLPGQTVVDTLSGLPCPYVSSTSYGLANEKKHEAVAFVDPSGASFADISECDGSCSPTLYLYDLQYTVTPGLDEPATGWVTINYDDFEAGNFGSYVSGGSKAVVSDSTGCGGSCACLGAHAVELSASGIAASFSSNGDLACDAYSLLRITFQFQFNGYDHLDTLFAELSLDGGTTYAIVGDWALDAGEEYVNGGCASGKVLVTPVMLRALSFGNEVRLRFRNSANANNDRVYVDDIRVEGHSGDGV